MEDADGGLSFDFEGGLESIAFPSAASNAGQAPSSASAAPSVGGFSSAITSATGAQKGPQGGRRQFKQTVCRHWLRGLCMKGDVCGYLHQYDKARMPMCRFYASFGECRETDCIYKHTNEDIKECNMYKLGFCPNGPDCRYRHQKMPGPFPPLEESLQKIHHRIPAANGGLQGRHPPQKHALNHFPEEGQPWQQPSHGRGQGAPAVAEDSHNAQQQRLPKPQQQQPPSGLNQAQSQAQATPPSNGAASQPNFVSASTPLPRGNSRYFIVKSSNRENLELSVERGMWATHRNNEAKLNDAFSSCDNVILIFSVNETRHFQGCARMMSKIGVVGSGGGWKFAHGTAHYGRNFHLKWLKLCELSFYKTRHLRNPYNENLPVKISRDCQELEPTVGEELASLLYMEPDSDLMVVANEPESRHTQEKGHGMSSGREEEGTNIVSFEHVDDDQEEESDEDDSSGQPASANRGRGRSGVGRGPTWNSQLLPKARGGRAMSGPRNLNFHMNIGTADGFGMGFDRFAMGSRDGYSELFSSATGPGRGFPPYGHPGPRFSGPDFSNLGPGAAMTFGPMDGSVPAPGMVFAGRPPTANGMFPHSAPGMMGPPGASIMGGVGPVNMMGAARPHFMGGPGAAGRPRPSGMPFRPSQGGANGRGRRGSTEQQKRRRNERSFMNERTTTGELKTMGRARQGLPSSGEPMGLDSEVESHGSVRQQQDSNAYANKTYAGENEDDSESEDEAPRRSRHGEGKKKRRDWDGDLAFGGNAWNQRIAKGEQWGGTDAEDTSN
eukprot:c27014_g1_i1 orf=264-2606(+)